MWPPQNALLTEAHHIKSCESPSTIPPEHLLPSPVTPSSDRSFPHLDVLRHSNRHITPLDTVSATDATELSRVDPALLHASTMHSPPLSVESTNENGAQNLLPLTIPMDTRPAAPNHIRPLNPLEIPSGLAALPRKSSTERSELTTSMKGGAKPLDA